MLWPPSPGQCARGSTKRCREFKLRPYYASRATTILRRHYAADTIATKHAGARFNEIGVQQVSSSVHRQIFPDRPFIPRQDLVELSRKHLASHELLGKNQDDTLPVDMQIPSLQGKSLDEHFQRIANAVSEPYMDYAKRFATSTIPQRPRKWIRRSGWTKYNSDMTTEEIDRPDEQTLSFDVETMWKETPFAVMACAASPTAWYAWISPWLLGETENPRQLIPLGDPGKERIVVGHNIGYLSLIHI